MKKTFRIIMLSLFIAQSLVLYIVEGMLPVPFIAPGAKLGLANLITVIAMYSRRENGMSALFSSFAFSWRPLLAVGLTHSFTAWPVLSSV